jgi:hypothetical protein
LFSLRWSSSQHKHCNKTNDCAGKYPRLPKKVRAQRPSGELNAGFEIFLPVLVLGNRDLLWLNYPSKLLRNSNPECVVPKDLRESVFPPSIALEAGSSEPVAIQFKLITASVFNEVTNLVLLPVPYYLLTVMVPTELRGAFLHFPEDLYPAFFAAVSGALKALCARRKLLGANIGFIAILHTWTRRMLFHPHIHMLVPPVGLAPGGCQLSHPRNQEYLLPQKALAHATREAINKALPDDHPEILARIETAAWHKPWVAQVQGAGRGAPPCVTSRPTSRSRPSAKYLCS